MSDRHGGQLREWVEKIIGKCICDLNEHLTKGWCDSCRMTNLIVTVQREAIRAGAEAAEDTCLEAIQKDRLIWNAHGDVVGFDIDTDAIVAQVEKQR